MKNKKKLIIVLLLLLAVCITGYGVYSYYWTEGTFAETSTDDSSGYDNKITISGKFDPLFDNDSSTGFLGDGGTISLTCPETSGGSETIDCTGTLKVKNEGSTSISVEVLDIHPLASADEGDILATAGTPTFNWTTTTISSSSSSNLTVSVPITIDNGTTGGLDSDDPEEVTGPVSGGSVSASITFKLKATQVND